MSGAAGYKSADTSETAMTTPTSLPITRRTALRLAGAAALLTPTGALAVPRVIPAEATLTEDAVLRDPEIAAIGNPDGDVTIVDYFDYNCPYCRKVDPELRQVVQDDGKIRLIYKDWTVLGPVSVYAAQMTQAAKIQDKYLAAHEKLISSASRLTEAGIRDRLADAGIDVERATRDLDAKKAKIDALLARNDGQAKAFGFRGTPAFIIGKFRVPGVLTMAQFEQAVADARKAAAKKT